MELDPSSTFQILALKRKWGIFLHSASLHGDESSRTAVEARSDDAISWGGESIRAVEEVNQISWRGP